MIARVTLDEVKKTVNRLPSLPAVVLDLLASLDDDNVDLDTLAAKIALDQALSAKTLRLANSSFYGVQRQVATTREAIAVLGFRTLCNLVTTAALVGSIGKNSHPSFGFLGFWRHSIATALCASAIASKIGQNADVAYTAGLIHDIGRLVLATQFSDAYERVSLQLEANDGSPLDVEHAVLGVDHAMVGEALTRHWKLPESIQQSTARHHEDGLFNPGSVTTIVHVADAVAHALDLAGDPHERAPVIRDQTLRALGLDQDGLIAVFREVEKKFDMTCNVLT
jgi:putative nucleotidyltransferase with HDIG domain